VLTLQALGEFFHATTRKRIVARHDAATQVRDLLAIFPTAAADVDAFTTALAVAEQGRSSFWDGLLVATAARAGCTCLLTEDMQDGARVDGVTILDPFVGEELPDQVAELLR
jgi:predicted nucleic acid-binding protein